MQYRGVDVKTVEDVKDLLNKGEKASEIYAYAGEDAAFLIAKVLDELWSDATTAQRCGLETG